MRIALALFLALPLRAAVPDVASSATVTLRGSGVYRVTGTNTIQTIAGVRDGDEIVLLPAAAFGMNSAGNIAPLTTTATVGRPVHLVVANGVVYELGPSVAPPSAPTDAQYWVGAADATLSAEKNLGGFTGIVKNTGGIPSAAVAGDFPTLNQNTTGTAAGLSSTLAVGSGGTGQTTAQAAINALTAVSGATNEHVLTKDTATGNATFKAGGSGGAPTGAQYVTLATDGTLTAERTLAGESSVVSITDGGAGNAVTVGIAANGITSAKLFQIAGRTLVGRFDTSIGNFQQISAGAANQIPRTTSTDLSFSSIPSCSDATTSKLLYNTTSNQFTCGTDQTGGGSSATVLILAGDISTAANTTPVNLTGMSFSATAAKTYLVEVAAAVQSPVATTGHGFGVNCTAAPVLVQISGAHQLANTGTTTRWSSIANNAIAGVSSGVPTAATNVPSVGHGIIRAHATTTNTCQFIFRSETTAVTTAKAGSVIRVTQLD